MKKCSCVQSYTAGGSILCDPSKIAVLTAKRPQRLFLCGLFESFEIIGVQKCITILKLLVLVSL